MQDWYPKRRFGDLADAIAARHPDHEGLVFKSRRYTFSQIAEEINLAAKALIKGGVRSGEHVALWLNNSDDWIFISFALAKIGAIQIPINTRFRTNDFAYVVNQSESRVLITHNRCGPIDYLRMVREAVSLPTGADKKINDPNFPNLRQIVVLDDKTNSGVTSWAEMKQGGKSIDDTELKERAASVEPDDPVFIMYTSGTTGFPKGAMHSHKLIRNVEERGFQMGITPNDTILNYLPLFHAFGYSEGSLMSLIRGAKQVITEIFDPDECLDLIERERATIVHGFEAHLKGLAESQEKKPRNIKSLRTGIFAAGMHSATPIARKGAKILAPLRAVSGYGMTEIWLGVGICAQDDDEKHRCESSGYPGLGYEVRIVDPETRIDQPVGIPGEIIVKGFSLMLGYYNKPNETAACFDRDGWFYTGDTAEWLNDGYFRFLGRYKDMLKVGGENVDPMETEGHLLDHPYIYQVAVVGLQDDRLSEIPVAFVQLISGANLKEDEVIEYCKGAVASFKTPRHVIFIDEFPMTASGKIKKFDLREQAKRLLL